MSSRRSRWGYAITASLMVLGGQMFYVAQAGADSQADLAITKTDGRTVVTPGGSTTYTITASNAGPSNAPGATVADTLPAALTGTWTCVGAGGGTCTASGSGNINDTVNLPAGGSVTYTVSATISAAATGSVSNTATVSAPPGVTDPNPANNSTTDTDTVLDNDLALTGVPANIITPATGPTGAVVSYTPPTATDENGETPTVGCLRVGIAVRDWDDHGPLHGDRRRRHQQSGPGAVHGHGQGWLGAVAGSACAGGGVAFLDGPYRVDGSASRCGRGGAARQHRSCVHGSVRCGADGSAGAVIRPVAKPAARHSAHTHHHVSNAR